MVTVKRFRRWLIHGLAAVSFLIAVWMGAAWASRLLPPQFQIPIRIIFNRPQYSFRCDGAVNYVVVLSIHHQNPPIIGPFTWDHAACRRFEKQFVVHEFEAHGFAFRLYIGPIILETYGFPDKRAGMFKKTMTGTQTFAAIGFGYFPLVFSLLPLAVWLGPLIRWTRRRYVSVPGFCKTCGYDLRATPDRCPECGTVPKTT